MQSFMGDKTKVGGEGVFGKLIPTNPGECRIKLNKNFIMQIGKALKLTTEAAEPHISTYILHAAFEIPGRKFSSVVIKYYSYWLTP